MTKAITTNTIGTEITTDTKKGIYTASSKTTVNGKETTADASGKVNLKYRGITFDLKANTSVSTNGTVKVGAEVSKSGANGEKLKVGSSLTTAPNTQNIKLSVGVEKKDDKRTISNSAYFKIKLQ